MEGHDVEHFAASSQVLAQNLVCPVCMLVPAAGQLSVLAVCSHPYCETCINAALDSKRACSFDNRPLSEDEQPAEPGALMQRLHHNLELACPNRGRGCPATCTVGTYAAHVAVCAKEALACTGVGCGHTCARDELAAHVGMCLHVSVPCGFCSDAVKRGELEEHQAACGSELVSCAVEGCGVGALPRWLVARHMAEAAADHVHLQAATIAALRAELAETQRAREGMVAERNYNQMLQAPRQNQPVAVGPQPVAMNGIEQQEIGQRGVRALNELQHILTLRGHPFDPARYAGLMAVFQGRMLLRDSSLEILVQGIEARLDRMRGGFF